MSCEPLDAFLCGEVENKSGLWKFILCVIVDGMVFSGGYTSHIREFSKIAS